MQKLENSSWVQKFGHSLPIKNIMNCVDELEKNYERRLSDLKKEYQNDVEEILKNYRKEKQELKLVIEQQTEKINSLISKLEAAHNLYHTEQVEHKISKDSLQHARQEIQLLSDALKTEQELIAITEEKVKTLNDQIAFQLNMDLRKTPSDPSINQAQYNSFFKKLFNFKLYRKIQDQTQ